MFSVITAPPFGIGKGERAAQNLNGGGVLFYQSLFGSGKGAFGNDDGAFFIEVENEQLAGFSYSVNIFPGINAVAVIGVIFNVDTGSRDGNAGVFIAAGGNFVAAPVKQRNSTECYTEGKKDNGIELGGHGVDKLENNKDGEQGGNGGNQPAVFFDAGVEEVVAVIAFGKLAFYIYDVSMTQLFLFAEDLVDVYIEFDRSSTTFL